MGFKGLGQWLCKPGGDGSAVGGCEGEEERMRENGQKRMEKEMVMVSAVEVQRVQVAGGGRKEGEKWGKEEKKRKGRGTCTGILMRN